MSGMSGASGARFIRACADLLRKAGVVPKEEEEEKEKGGAQGGHTVREMVVRVDWYNGGGDV